MVDRQDGTVYQQAKEIITTYLRLGEDELQPNSHIVDDIGADSLALVELGFQLSERFGVAITDTSDDKLVFGNLVQYIEDNMTEAASLS
jgi:acyl carrier protein